MDSVAPATGPGTALPQFELSEAGHVWIGQLDDHVGDAWRSVLSPAERTAADRFLAPLHRTRYAVAHGRLRQILGSYLGGTHYEGGFSIGAHGKPFLPGAPGLQFNLAHAGDRFAVAVSRHPVGVDIEAIDREVEVERIITSFFSETERTRLLDLPSADHLASFFHLWTQKEAYLKGRGDGVVFGLDHFDVEAAPDRPARLHADRRDPTATGRWHLGSSTAISGYRLAWSIADDPDPARLVILGPETSR